MENIPQDANRVRIAESGNVWYRVAEGAYTGPWEPSAENSSDAHWDYIGATQLASMGTVVAEDAACR